jgi:cysteinyl-tRNA synthetase
LDSGPDIVGIRSLGLFGLGSFSKSFSSRTQTELDTNYLLQHNRRFEMNMKTLNVLSPNLNIHSSDYLEEIQACIKDIVAKGRSYESKSSWNSGQPETFIECCAISKTLFSKKQFSVFI